MSPQGGDDGDHRHDDPRGPDRESDFPHCGAPPCFPEMCGLEPPNLFPSIDNIGYFIADVAARVLSAYTYRSVLYMYMWYSPIRDSTEFFEPLFSVQTLTK